jgi:hypothetical protein
MALAVERERDDKSLFDNGLIADLGSRMKLNSVLCDSYLRSLLSGGS